MFIGHHAAALAAKRFAPRLSLGLLFGAAMWLDLVWPLLTLAGVEHFRIDPGNTAFTPLAVANIVSPPPPSWQAVAWTALAAWLFVLWGWWIDRHRRPRE